LKLELKIRFVYASSKSRTVRASFGASCVFAKVEDWSLSGGLTKFGCLSPLGLQLAAALFDILVDPRLKIGNIERKGESVWAVEVSPSKLKAELRQQIRF
jgi:hypothetical protein